jgi:hypothetical protein
MTDCIHTNIVLDPGFRYFMYIGELKTHCLNDFLRGAHARRFGVPLEKVRHVSIVQDVLEVNDHENIMVINTEAEKLRHETDGRRVARRVPMNLFSAQVSQSQDVRRLIQKILSWQDKLPIWMFENKAELSLRDIPGVELFGPDPSLVYQCNDKAWQYDTFYGMVPTVDYKTCCGCDELLLLTERMRDSCTQGVFVTYTYSAGGSHSRVTQTQEEVSTFFNNPYATYLASPYIPHVLDPTVLGIVANHRDVYIAGVADMRIEDRKAFRGSTYPSRLPENIQAELREHTRTVGRKLGTLGFRGIFGCDFVVDDSGDIYFIEVNPRKQGTTMEFVCMLEQLFPPGAPNFMELEHHAVTHGVFPQNTPWPDFGDAVCKRDRLHWGTYNYKLDQRVLTTKRLPQAMPEVELFRRCHRRGQGGHLILEHVGADTVVKPGTFLARVVAVDATRQGMLERLEQGIQEIRESFITV